MSRVVQEDEYYDEDEEYDDEDGEYADEDGEYDEDCDDEDCDDVEGEDPDQTVLPIWALRDTEGEIWLRFGEEEGENYIHAKTQETRKDIDLDTTAEVDDVVMLTDWEYVANGDDEEMTYFYNVATGESVWDLFMPTEDGEGFNPFQQREAVRNYEQHINEFTISYLKEAGYEISSTAEIAELPEEAKQLVASMLAGILSGETVPNLPRVAKTITTGSGKVLQIRLGQDRQGNIIHLAVNDDGDAIGMLPVDPNTNEVIMTGKLIPLDPDTGFMLLAENVLPPEIVALLASMGLEALVAAESADDAELTHKALQVAAGAARVFGTARARMSLAQIGAGRATGVSEGMAGTAPSVNGLLPPPPGTSGALVPRPPPSKGTSAIAGPASHAGSLGERAVTKLREPGGHIYTVVVGRKATAAAGVMQTSIQKLLQAVSESGLEVIDSKIVEGPGAVVISEELTEIAFNRVERPEILHRATATEGEISVSSMVEALPPPPTGYVAGKSSGSVLPAAPKGYVPGKSAGSTLPTTQTAELDSAVAEGSIQAESAMSAIASQVHAKAAVAASAAATGQVETTQAFRPPPPSAAAKTSNPHYRPPPSLPPGGKKPDKVELLGPEGEKEKGKGGKPKSPGGAKAGEEDQAEAEEAKPDAEAEDGVDGPISASSAVVFSPFSSSLLGEEGGGERRGSSGALLSSPLLKKKLTEGETTEETFSKTTAQRAIAAAKEEKKADASRLQFGPSTTKRGRR